MNSSNCSLIFFLKKKKKKFDCDFSDSYDSPDFSDLFGLFSTFPNPPPQMETEPVVASEPVFSVAPCVQVPAAVVPNGSSSGGAAQAKVGKVTAEQLAAVEDEELLDKMVLHFGS